MISWAQGWGEEKGREKEREGVEIGRGGGWRWLQFRASGESVSGLRNPQSHTERCMNEKELAVLFIGFPPHPFHSLLPFAWFHARALFSSVVLSAASWALDLLFFTGQAGPEHPRKTRSPRKEGLGLDPARGQNVSKGDAKKMEEKDGEREAAFLEENIWLLLFFLMPGGLCALQLHPPPPSRLRLLPEEKNPKIESILLLASWFCFPFFFSFFKQSFQLLKEKRNIGLVISSGFCT